MDTYINVKVYTNDKELASKALKEVDNIYKEYHQLTDRYNAYDNIINLYYINHSLEINEEITIDKKLYDVIKYGFDYYNESNGLLNIALGNVIDIWKMYRDGIKEGIPTIDELKNSGSISINDLVLGSNNTVSKKSNISLDLGAFAKGYTTELAGKYLESIGIDKYIINAGGNVKVGNHYNNDKYKIGIERPTDTADVYKIVKGNNISVITSGGYERFYEYKGIKYHHIIGASTLFPPQYMLSVTVITNDSARGDAMSTMLFLMPIDKGLEYVNSHNDIEALWYGVDNKVYYSKGFDKYE
jgi:thiamine biosynthesis lipoprotein